MQYTEGEIVREYQQARYKNKQIGILSQLNTCSRKDIIEILERNGVEIPDKYKASREEEYNYSVMVSKEKKSPKFKETPINTKRKPKSSEPKQEEVKTPELDEEIEVYELNKTEKPKTDPERDVPKEKSDGLYYTTWLRLELLDRKMTKLERKYKRLKKMYKQLAKYILG